jgi:hypothetical protein
VFDRTSASSEVLLLSQKPLVPSTIRRQSVLYYWSATEFTLKQPSPAIFCESMRTSRASRRLRRRLLRLECSVLLSNGIMLNTHHYNAFLHFSPNESSSVQVTPSDTKTEAFFFNNFAVIYGELLPQNRGQKITFATYAPCHPELADGCSWREIILCRII